MDGLRLQGDELATLIRESVDGKSIELNWLVRGVELKAIPNNDWALRRVAAIRGIDLSTPTPEATP